MPYITQERRTALHKFAFANSPGELNYLLTRTVMQYVKAHNRLNYQVINDVLGALEGAKAEFYRRVAAPYEDIKIKENGDVY